MFSVLFPSFRSGNILPLSLKDKEKESAGKKGKYLFRRNVLLFKLFLPLGNHAVLCAPDRIFPFMPLFCGKTDFFFIDFNSKPRSG